MKLSLEVWENQNGTVVRCRGRIVYREAAALSQKVSELLPHSRRLVLDLEGVEMIDSAGLGELVLLHMWAQAAGCEVKLAGASENIRQLLELTNLASVFEIHPSAEQALDSFRERVAGRKACA